MELYIYDRDLNLLGAIDNFNSFRVVHRYHESGEFELHTNITSRNLELLQRQNIITIKGGKDAWFIEYRNLRENEDGSESLAVKGYHITGYLKKRIIWGRTYVTEPVEDVMRRLVSESSINPDNPDRKIPRLELGPIMGFNEVIRFQSSFQNIENKLKELSQVHNIGYKIEINDNRDGFIFRLYQGEDRSIEQSKNDHIIFSKEFENVLYTDYTESEIDAVNTCLIAGAHEGADRIITTIEEGQGLDRKELYVDARDLTRDFENDKGEIEIMPMDHYLDLLERRGWRKIKERMPSEAFESNINLHGNNKYGEDFFLGDLITFRSQKWGIYVNTRITEVEEAFEEDGRTIHITFGNAVPTIIQKLKDLIPVER